MNLVWVSMPNLECPTAVQHEKGLEIFLVSGRGVTNAFNRGMHKTGPHQLATAYTASRAQARVYTRGRRKQIQKKNAGNAGHLRARERIVNILCDLGRGQIGQA